MQIYGLQRVFFPLRGPGNYGNKTLAPCFCGRRCSNLIKVHFLDYSSHMPALTCRFEDLRKCCRDTWIGMLPWCPDYFDRGDEYHERNETDKQQHDPNEPVSNSGVQ